MKFKNINVAIVRMLTQDNKHKEKNKTKQKNSTEAIKFILNTK